MKTLRDRLLTIVCIAVLCGTLSLGLWPFHVPRNEVEWLSGNDGVRFGEAGAIYSVGALALVAAPDSGCTVEAWARPASVRGAGVLLSFYRPEQAAHFTVRQSLSDLQLQLNAGPDESQKRELYAGGVFGREAPVFFAVSSGPEGTAIYVNGRASNMARQFRIRAADCASELSMGASPVQPDRWRGELRGVAVYHRELNASGISRHYRSWMSAGRPDILRSDLCAALYEFDEHAGRRIHDRNGTSNDLVVPERFTVHDKAFLMPFWRELASDSGYWRSVVKNIVGLVPLGFFFYAWFASRTSPQRAVWRAVLTGTLVSVTIEVLQGFLPTRESGTTDIFSNTFGTWIGVTLYRYVGPRWQLIRTEGTGLPEE